MFVLHVPAVLAVIAAVLLGNWQLGAWQTHREDRAAELADATPVPLEDVLGPDDPFPGDGVGRPVTTTGRWLPDAAVLVSGREHDGRDGYWVVVPFLTCRGEDPACAGAAAIPVVVGWSGTADETPPAPSGPSQVVGWLQPGEAAAGPDTDPDDRVLPALRVADLLQRVDEDLYGGYVILRTPAADRGELAAVTPDSLPEAPTSTALRNLLYGIEWWLFAGFAVFLWWRWSRDEIVAARARAADVSPLSADADAGSTVPDARIPSEP
jgi:cytochrome oxidase assembly protein ShyY1